MTGNNKRRPSSASASAISLTYYHKLLKRLDQGTVTRVINNARVAISDCSDAQINLPSKRHILEITNPGGISKERLLIYSNLRPIDRDRHIKAEGIICRRCGDLIRVGEFYVKSNNHNYSYFHHECTIAVNIL